MASVLHAMSLWKRSRAGEEAIVPNVKLIISGGRLNNLTKLLLFCLCTCIGLSVALYLIVLVSWQGGTNGIVNVTTNVYHERLLETILFPILIIGGIWGLFKLRR